MTPEKRIQELETLVSRFMAENAELKVKISRLEAPQKDSSNSSIPPSQDPFRSKRTESLREKSGKKPGGQPGHEGSTLQLSDTPTEIIYHHPESCAVCGSNLSDIPAEFSGKRQVIDIPPIVPVITEHQIYRKVCTCGYCNEAGYPERAHSTVCYRENLMSLSAYFHSLQYIPYDRMGELFRDIFGVHPGNGSLVNLTERFAQKAHRCYKAILLETLFQNRCPDTSDLYGTPAARVEISEETLSGRQMGFGVQPPSERRAGVETGTSPGRLLTPDGKTKPAGRTT